MSNNFIAYTDGGYHLQKDKGAYAFIILKDDLVVHKDARVIRKESNNRAELKAIINAVAWCPDEAQITVRSDSKYAINTLQGEWQRKKNTDLFDEWDGIISRKKVTVTFEWVHGHNGDKYNEMCDRMCNEVAECDLNSWIPGKESKLRVRFVKNASETIRGVVLPDGRIVSLFDEDGKWIGYNYGTVFDIETGEVFPDAEPDGKTLVTLNILADQNGKRLEEVQCFREHVINLTPKFPKSLSKKRIDMILKEFHKNGFNVTENAVMHQFNCWQKGYKSGYRDEENNYYLFTPCGANPFSLRATELHPLCSDWQKTYCC